MTRVGWAVSVSSGWLADRRSGFSFSFMFIPVTVRAKQTDATIPTKKSDGNFRQEKSLKPLRTGWWPAQ